MPEPRVNPAEKVHDHGYLYDPDVSCEEKSPKYLFPKTERGPFPDFEKHSTSLGGVRDDFPLFDKAPMKRSESSEQSGLTSED